MFSYSCQLWVDMKSILLQCCSVNYIMHIFASIPSTILAIKLEVKKLLEIAHSWKSKIRFHEARERNFHPLFNSIEATITINRFKSDSSLCKNNFFGIKVFYKLAHNICNV